MWDMCNNLMASEIIITWMLFLIAFSGWIACFAFFWLASSERVKPDSGYHDYLFDALRSLGLFCGWIGSCALAGIFTPCSLLRANQFIGMWLLWLGVPLVSLRFVTWVWSHKRRGGIATSS